jgi:very-short-patch-repair endonuclease
MTAGGKEMSGDLILRLTEEGLEKDGNKSFQWQPAAVAVNDVARAMSRFAGGSYAAASELNSALETVEEKYRQQVRDAFEKGYPKCESTIEFSILPWLLAQRYFFFEYYPLCLLPGEGEQLKDGHLAVIPQLPVGSFRADFALAARKDGVARFVLVECDGAAYHDSAEQVVRDVNRDVRILANDRVLDIVRISAKDILLSPQNAATNAAQALTNAWRKDNRALDYKFKT